MPSDCLSAPDSPSDDPEPSSDPPDPEEPEEPDFLLEVAPFALAREVPFIRFFAFVLTLMFFALRLRDRRDFVLSFSTDTVKDPPTPTLSPAAAAFAASCLNMSLLAVTSALPAQISIEVPFPMCAFVSVPATSSARTGVMEMPPAAPATPSTVCVSVVDAVTLISVSFALSLSLITGAVFSSSISATVSIPETEIAMPAPTPAFSDFAAPLALALVSSLTVLAAVTFSGPPVSVTCAVSFTTASVLTVST